MFCIARLREAKAKFNNNYIINKKRGKRYERNESKINIY